MIIDGINFKELESEKFWSFPASYKKDSKAETRNMIFSNDYLGSAKKDGAYYRFIKDNMGNMVLQGRSRSVSGEFLNKIGHVPHLYSFFEALPNGTCLLGELYFPNNEGSNQVTKIMGCKEDKAIQRQNMGDKLHYYVFDVWAFDADSCLKNTMEERCEKLRDELFPMEKDFEYVEVAKYCRGSELWELLESTLAAGGEGVVMTRANSYPEPGKRTARKTLKVKKEIANTIDCFFTGNFTAPSKEYTGKEIESWKYWINLQTGQKMEGEFYKEYSEGSPIEPITKPYFNGWAGSLEIGVVKGDKVVPIGLLSGLADEIKANAAEYKGKVIEISCMELQYHDDGRMPGLRHAKLIQFREDLTIRDCTYEKVFGDVH